jgi:hypothetical protein
VIYLGMRVRTLTGIRTLSGFGPRIMEAGDARPEGLLHFEQNIIYGFFPLHLGMRWYWKDFESMERWTRSEPHLRWWQDFLRNSGGTGFWHEAYFMRGGMEAVYDDLNLPSFGFQAFAPNVPSKGLCFRQESGWERLRDLRHPKASVSLTLSAKRYVKRSLTLSNSPFSWGSLFTGRDSASCSNSFR